MTRRGFGVGLVGLAMAALGCGPSPITSSRIEAAIAPTFANLVHVQLSRIGLRTVAASDISVTATCRKVAGGGEAVGAGDWVCTLVWSGSNGRPLRDTYDLSVGTDGCYSATADSSEGQLGGPIVKTADGADVRNLLYAFDSCFDPT